MRPVRSPRPSRPRVLTLAAPSPRKWISAFFFLVLLALLFTAAVALGACTGSPDGVAGAGGEEGAVPPPADPGAASGAPHAPGAEGGDLAAAREAWDRALSAHVRAGGLDYAALQADRGDLDAYLRFAREAAPEHWSEDDRRAFWINAYNAVVADAVLAEYPEIESVQKVDGFFKRSRHRIAGEPRTLDEIEAEALGDARVHFAVICGAESCPPLRPEAYRGELLDEQLEDQTGAFLDDPERGFRFEPERGEAWLSKLFDWYGEDFAGQPAAWVEDHLPETLAGRLRELREAGDLKVRFISYDWSLNDRTGGG